MAVAAVKTWEKSYRYRDSIEIDLTKIETVCIATVEISTWNRRDRGYPVPRLWLSRRELVCRGEIVSRSHFLLDISAWFFEISPRSGLSRHERAYRGEIAMRSCREVDISTRSFQISPRWWLSRRDCGYLVENRFAVARSRRDLAAG